MLVDITSRQEKLIELMSSKEAYLPAKYYADYLEVSERTIFNDIDKLEALFKSFNIVVDKKPNQGIKLSGDIVSSSNFYQHILKHSKMVDTTINSPLDRQTLIVKWLLLENQTLTYQSMSMDLYISTTSIIKDLDRIKSFMNDEVSLISDSKGTRVKGTEIGIQKTLKRFAYYLIEQSIHNYSISSYAKSLEPLFDKNVIKRVNLSIQELISVIDRDISEQYLKSLFICLLILTERSYRGSHISKLPEVNLERAAYLTNFPLAVQICHSISSHLNFTFTELELRYMSNQLFAHRIEVKVSNKYIENLFAEDIRSIISDVSAAMDVDFIADDKLYDSLIYHMFPMIYRLKSDIAVHNPLLNEIKNNYGILFRMIWYVMESFEKKYDIKLSDDEVAFITVYFQVSIERKVQMAKILVVCQTGIVTSDLIINRIKTLLPANIRFKLIAKPSLKQEDLSKVDFIISSVQLKRIDCPVVYVSPLVRNADLMKIYSHYLKYTSEKSEKETHAIETDDALAYLDDKYLFLNDNATSKKACLDKLIQCFEKDGIVKSTFRESVYEREELGNTLIQNWIAVPHGQQALVNKTKIAIMTTKKPVKWNNESEVSLIILLAVAEEDIGIIRQLLGRLYKNILNSQSLEKDIKTLTNPNELIKSLIG